MSRKDWTDDKLLSRLFNNKSDRSRWDVIRILRQRPSEELFSKCIEFTKSNDPKIRIIGIDILAQLGLPQRPFLRQSIELFFDLLNIERDPGVLMSLLYAIGHNNANLSTVQIEKLCSFADNDNDWVKKGLVFSLLGVDKQNAIKALIKLSTAKKSDIRNWATFGIGTQTEMNSQYIRNALWSRIDDKHQETKLEAIVGLTKRKDNRVIEIIKKELNRGEFGTLLLEAVVESGEMKFIPLLRHNLKLIKDGTSINPEWKKDLKRCIYELTKLTNKKKRTTA